MDELSFGSLFAGIGGFDKGLEAAGMTCKWQIDNDDFCLDVLAKHWPDIRRYKDVRDCGAKNLESVELICGGFPCQDVSLAGKRKGLEGKRSTLWSEFYRIVCEIQPRWVIIENVPGLYTSDNGRFFAKILRELSQSGYDAKWDAIPARTLGAPHQRDRVFIIAYPQCIKRAHLDFNFLRPTIDRRNTRTWNGRRVDKPGIIRVVNGVPGQLDRLRMLGNSIVPQVSELIGKAIMEVERAN